MWVPPLLTRPHPFISLPHHMTKPGLTQLLRPRTPEEFFPQLQANQPFIVDKVTALDALTTLPFLQSLQTLFQVWPYSVQAHLPEVADEASAIEVSTTDARKLFSNGMGLMFEHAERISAELTAWLEAIRIDLGLSALTQSRCLLYATPDGKGTAPHFDQNANFVLQLHGTKTWWLAPNTHVCNPLTRHTMGLPVDAELQTYCELPMPTSLPQKSTPIVLSPGTLLFVPRGTWHSTEAQGDALSLNFTYTAPTWLDLFTAALRSRLALSPEWRATANGVANPMHRDAAQETFDQLLLKLTDDLPNWRAAEILEVTENS